MAPVLLNWVHCTCPSMHPSMRHRRAPQYTLQDCLSWMRYPQEIANQLPDGEDDASNWDMRPSMRKCEAKGLIICDDGGVKAHAEGEPESRSLRTVTSRRLLLQPDVPPQPQIPLLLSHELGFVRNDHARKRPKLYWLKSGLANPRKSAATWARARPSMKPSPTFPSPMPTRANATTRSS